MAEFTGERVIPGQVDADLWNEHLSRYVFAVRLSRMKRVLDVGCGTGYGALELRRTARQVTAIDVSTEAFDSATSDKENLKVNWVRASGASLPFAAAAFDLVVAFEVIEHLEDWRPMLDEIRRLLARGGQFIVSTPNKAYYSESRAHSGPNPFHHHEFEFAEFREELLRIFPHVSLFTQNHAEGIVFRPVAGAAGAEVHIENGDAAAEEAHFFLAVCALTPQTGSPSFVYVPRSANVLREREVHIGRLEGELAIKNTWLEEKREEHQRLIDLHREQKEQLEKSNTWAASLDTKLRAAGVRIVELQEEVTREQAAAVAKIAELEADNAAKTQWALDTESRLTREIELRDSELARCVEALSATEKTLEERTGWALRLDEEKQALATKIGMATASRWLRLGRAIGVGPELQDR